MNNLIHIIRYNKPNPKIIPKITAIMLNTFICVWLIFAFPLSVYASDHGGGGSTSDSITSWTDEQKADYFKTNFTRLLARTVGVIRGSDSADSVFNSFKNLYYTDTIQENMTWEQWLSQDLGWTFDDKGEPTITLSVNCQNAMQKAVDDWIETQGYIYVYTFDIKDFYSKFTSKDKYDTILNHIKQYGFCILPNSFDSYCSSFTYSLDDIAFVNETMSPPTFITSRVYDSNWHRITGIKSFNFSNEESSSFSYIGLSPSPHHTVLAGQYGTGFLFTDDVKRVKLYPTLDSFKADSVGTQTYYITNDYSKGATYNSTQTIDNSTLQNTISYETVQNFNKQYYDEHNTTANYETINNYITNYYETINNNGGSGGSGGGGGSDDSGGGIFDWLGSVGDILGSLIKGLGEIVVGLLDGIATVITSFIDTLPTQVNNLFGTLFDWLPPEIRSLIVLSITLSLIWGIIKLIRG